MAASEMHVFKYHDVPLVQFACQIEISVKPPNGQCAHPQCVAARRKRQVARIITSKGMRRIPLNAGAVVGVVDVRSQSFQPIQVDDTAPVTTPARLQSQHVAQLIQGKTTQQVAVKQEQQHTTIAPVAHAEPTTGSTRRASTPKTIGTASAAPRLVPLLIPLTHSSTTSIPPVHDSSSNEQPAVTRDGVCLSGLGE